MKAVLLRIPYIKYVADYVMPVLMIVCLFFAFSYFVRSISWKDIIFAIGVIIVYMVNIVIYPENEELIAIAGSFFFSVFPLYFIGLRLEPSKHFRILYIMSIINIWVFAAYYTIFGNSSFDAYSGTNTSYMGRAYILLPQLLMVLMGMFNKKSILNIVTGLVGFVLLLMCGNRGSVLLLFVFVVISLLFSIKKEKRVYVGIGACAVGGIIAYYYEMLMAMAVMSFEKFGLSIRVFERLSEGTFFDSNGRILILEELASAIWKNPIIGYGLRSDITITGSYAHNYAFELWTAFGVLFGSVILIATIFIMVSAWKKSREGMHKAFLLVLICSGFLKLFISSSFLLEGLFFMLIGYCVTQFRRGKLGITVLGEEKNENL